MGRNSHKFDNFQKVIVVVSSIINSIVTKCLKNIYFASLNLDYHIIYLTLKSFFGNKFSIL